jgi:hypothetical protein
MRAAVAQMVEHLAVNEVAPGSSPGGGVFCRELDRERSDRSVSDERAFRRTRADESHARGTSEASEQDRLGLFESWRRRVLPRSYVLPAAVGQRNRFDTGAGIRGHGPLA